MKYIKRFNEELKPETYVRAGFTLKGKPGNIKVDGGKRSTPMMDYGYSKKWGIYNMHFASNYLVVENSSFTNLRCDSYYSRPDSSNISSFQYSAEDAVEKWAKGEAPLCITFNFYFQATEETLDKVNNLSNLSSSNIKEIKSYVIPMFSFQVCFSDWEDGLDAYNSDDYGDGQLPDDLKVDEKGLYEWTNSLDIYIKPPVKMYFNARYPFCGIFSDRNSAKLFKEKLNDLLDPHKEKITELLSCVNGRPDVIDQYEDKIKEISINNLVLRSIGGVKPGSAIDTSKWFTYDTL